MGVIASIVASVLSFPIAPLHQWLNGKIRWLYCAITFQPTGLGGRWLAVYDKQSWQKAPSLRTELVKCSHLPGGEVRGTIVDESLGTKYPFLGRKVIDELIAHYWVTDGSKDTGTFKLTESKDHTILTGFLSMYVHDLNRTQHEIPYTWHRLPHPFVQFFKKVRKGASEIRDRGLFANRRFKRGETIGQLRFGVRKGQDEDTIMVNGEHRIVKKPWYFLNHSCNPNAKLEFRKRRVDLVATTLVLPQTELTIDYNLLSEGVGTPFDCSCPKCTSSGSPKRIGART